MKKPTIEIVAGATKSASLEKVRPLGSGSQPGGFLPDDARQDKAQEVHFSLRGLID